MYEEMIVSTLHFWAVLPSVYNTIARITARLSLAAKRKWARKALIWQECWQMKKSEKLWLICMHFEIDR